MAKAKKTESKHINNTPQVDEYMQKLVHPLKAEIEAVRRIIMNANSKILERVKWNAPSFFCRQLDMGAFNLRAKGFVQLILVFPKGLITDTSGLLLGDWKDRREARFNDMADVKAKKA